MDQGSPFVSYTGVNLNVKCSNSKLTNNICVEIKV